MLRASAKISDLFFTPGKPPLVEVNGKLKTTGPRALTADDTRKIAADLALSSLREKGSCDVSYSLAGSSRFRVNVFMQRGSCAIVMRVIPGSSPDFAAMEAAVTGHLVMSTLHTKMLRRR